MPRFDTIAGVPHPEAVLKVARRLAAVAAMLTLCVGNASLCAGWQSTPEARMACCMNGAHCPMHEAEASPSGSKRAITQLQADRCCAAASTRTQSTPPDLGVVLANATAPHVSSIVFVPAAVPALRQWRARVPLPASPVPKHLLLSVLLV